MFVGREAVEKGFEFDVEDPPEHEKEELSKTDVYWTRDEILAHLNNNPKPDDNLCADSEIYDERVKHMVEIVKDNVYKNVVREGAGDVITVNSAVLYNLNAYLEGQDEPFDSTWLRGRPNLHKLSYDTILPGICHGLLTMRRGERSEFIVRPEYAYLEMGCPPRVPPNATILYIIEVIRIFEEGSLSHFETLEFEEREKFDFSFIFNLCDEERISGNSYYKVGRFREAAFRYRRAIRNLEQIMYRSREDEDKAKQLLLKLYCNIANTYNKFAKPFNAMSNCKKALIIDPKCHKALYQYGLAKMMNADYEAAKDYLCRAKMLKPNSQEVDLALTRLDRRMNSDAITEKLLYTKMGSMFTKHDS